MGFLDRHTDVEGGKHSEDESLNVGHQAFEQRDEDAKEDADHTDGTADNGAEQIAEDENDDNESQDNNMASNHIGEKSDHEHDGLGKHSHQLDNRHQGEHFEPRRDTGGVENVDPIVTVTTDISD